MNYWIYSGSDLQEANEKANIAIELINAKGQEIFGGDVIRAAQIFTNSPTIGGVIYFCGFSAPPSIFVNGATCDLVTDFDYSWFEEI